MIAPLPRRGSRAVAVISSMCSGVRRTLMLWQGACVRLTALLHLFEPLQGPVQLSIDTCLVANQLLHDPGARQRGAPQLRVEIQLLAPRDLPAQGWEPA